MSSVHPKQAQLGNRLTSRPWGTGGSAYRLWRGTRRRGWRVRKRARANPVLDRPRWGGPADLLDREGNRWRDQRERWTLHSVGARPIETRMRVASRVAERKLLELRPAESRRLRHHQLVRRDSGRVVVSAVMDATGGRLEVMLMPVRQRAHRNGEAARECQEAGEETSRQGAEHEGKLMSWRTRGRGPRRASEWIAYTDARLRHCVHGGESKVRPPDGLNAPIGAIESGEERPNRGQGR